MPEHLGGHRANFALLTEQRIHQTMKKDYPNSLTGSNKWYYDLKNIINVIFSIKNEYALSIPK